MIPQNVYKQSSVNTAPPGKLVIMLYDGLLRFMNEASDAISSNQVEKAHFSLVKAQDIVLELRSTLNMNAAPEIAENLYNLYSFFYSKLVDANREKSTQHLSDIRGMLVDLRDAFVQADKQLVAEGRE